MCFLQVDPLGAPAFGPFFSLISFFPFFILFLEKVSSFLLDYTESKPQREVGHGQEILG
jgi:hypothetical protein